MQAQRHLGVLGGVRRGLLDRHLIKRQLFDAFTGDVLEMNGALSKILERQRIEIVATPGGVQHVRLQHGVFPNASQGNAMISQDVGVVFQVLPDLGDLLILQQGPQGLEHCVTVSWSGAPGIIVRQRHIGCCTGRHGERDSDHFRHHIVEACRFGIEGE